MGSGLTTMGRLNLQNHQGHMLAFNQKPSGYKFEWQGWSVRKRGPDQLGVIEMVNRQKLLQGWTRWAVSKGAFNLYKRNPRWLVRSLKAVTPIGSHDSFISLHTWARFQTQNPLNEEVRSPEGRTHGKYTRSDPPQSFPRDVGCRLLVWETVHLRKGNTNTVRVVDKRSELTVTFGYSESASNGWTS